MSPAHAQWYDYYFLEDRDHANAFHLSRINRSLEKFIDAWNNHGIHNHSPRQLFSLGILCLQHSGLVANDFIDPVDSYGVDDDESPSPCDDASDGVNVPEIHTNLPKQVLTDLRQEVDPLATRTNHAIELYEQALATITNLTLDNHSWMHMNVHKP